MTSAFPVSLRRMGALATTNSGILAMVTVGNIALRMVSSVVLTRLLMPEAFGLVGIIGSIFYIVGMITDLGFTAYIVRDERGDDPHFINVLWTIHAVRGIVMTVAGIAIAPLLAMILDKPSLAWPAAVAMLTLAIGGFQSFGAITTLRHGGAKRLTIFDFMMTVLQVVINVGVAVVLRDVWSLILSMIIQNVIRTILSFVVFDAPRPSFVNDPIVRREFFRFSRIAASSSIITLAIMQADKFVLARLFTLAEFGIYGIATTLAATLIGFAENYVNRVIYPKYAAVVRDDPSAMASQFYRIKRVPSLLYAFASGGMVGGAGLIVAILYDPRYAAAATFLSLLAVGASFRIQTVAAGQMLMAAGSFTPTLHSNILRLIWVAGAGTAGYLSFGALGIVATVGTIEVAAMPYFWIKLRQIRVLDMGQEVLLIACTVAGAGIGYATATTAHLIWPAL